MTRAYVEAPATHYRLSADTWAIIAEEYKNGATAKDIGAKWKVAPSSVYRYACRDGFSKKTMGDARARAHARMVEEEEASARALHPVGSRALKSLFAPEREGEAEAGDAAALSRTAVLASGRAMRGRLWSEAKALAGLAESYARLGGRDARGVTIETMDPWALLELIADPDGRIPTRFARSPDPNDDPEAEVKDAYWRWQTNIHKAVSNNLKELMLRAISAEKLVRSMGGTPRLNETDVDIEAWAREWLAGPPSEANVHARTKLGAWPWR